MNGLADGLASADLVRRAAHAAQEPDRQVAVLDATGRVAGDTARVDQESGNTARSGEGRAADRRYPDRERREGHGRQPSARNSCSWRTRPDARTAAPTQEEEYTRVAEASLSVTLPAFGDNQLLRQAVASVVAQDVPTWTLQVFDDGPADPALEQWLRDLDPRVRYTWNPTRLGLSRNFQQCLDAADSGLVTIMGADDLMAPAFVRRMLDAARRRPEAVMYQPRVQVIDGEGRPAAPVTDRLKALLTPSPRQVLGGERLAISLLRGNWLYFPAMVFRTADARTAGFRQGRDIVVDLDLYLRLLLTGGRLVLVDEELFRYRRHEQSLSSIERLTGSRFLEEKAFFGEMVAAMREHGWSRAGRAARVHLTSRLHAGLLVPVAVSARNRDLARALVRHTIGRAPTPSIPS